MRNRLPKTVRLLLLFIFILGGSQWSNTAYSAEPAPTVPCTGTIRIMPLGDSITKGSASGVTDEALMISYRKDLYDGLVASYGSVDFVGSLTNGEGIPDFDPKHEGHAGWTDSQVAANIYNWLVNLGSSWPNIILLHIGTNSPNESATDVENILNAIDDFEDPAAGKEITVVLALIIDNEVHNQIITNFNNNVESMAQARIDAGDDIVIVDMEDSAGLVYRNYQDEPPGGDFYDNLHPWKTGYSKMAVVWKSAVDNVMASCNNPPIIDNPGAQTSAEGDTPSLAIQADPGDQGQTLTYSTKLPYGDPDAVDTLPPGLSIDPVSGVISGTIGFEAASEVPYHVTITVEDDGVPSRKNSVTFNWTVTNTNRPPNANDDEHAATEEQVLSVPLPGILANDTDPDGDPISAALLTPPGHGNLTLSANGAFTYTPYANYFGPDSFTYKASDGAADSNMATVEITVTGEQDPPSVVNPGNQSHAEKEPVSLQIVASDVDGDALSFAISGQPVDLQINPETGLITGVPDYGSAAGSPYYVIVTVSDGSDSVAAVFSWTVLQSWRPLLLPMITRK